MVKNALLLLAAASCFSTSYAQRCYTDELHRQLIKSNPQISVIDAQLKAEIDARLGKMDVAKFKTTAPGDTAFTDQETLIIPIVFHLIHDYGSENVSDNDIYKIVDEINASYAGAHPGINQVIPLYKGNIPGTNIKYIAKTNIKFVLPTKDPKGNPTHGIVRRNSYLTYFGDDQSKFDPWPQDSYINIWVVRQFGGSVGPNVGAYALYPSAAAQVPWRDGVIGIPSGNDINYDARLAHELAHSLDLAHVWNVVQTDPGLVTTPCGDDNVDDTPPTKGHTNCSAAQLYDTTCAVGYMKTYSGAQAYNLFGLDPSISHVINYPDTVNTQNIMDYSGCKLMFTHLQSVHMRTALRSPIAGRNKLYSPANLAITGALAPWPDLPPIADFSVSRMSGSGGFGPNVFSCSGKSVTFFNRSWNDTIQSVSWNFSNGASSSVTSPTQQANVVFTSPGWASVSLTANSNAGSNTITRDRAVYVADSVPVSTVGYFQEFNTGLDPANYPMFNHFGNDSKWEVVENAGFYDNKSIRYKNYDTRSGITTAVGTPIGDFDDFFTPAFDLSSAPSNYKLNFFTSGAFRTNKSAEMLDTLEIRYSIDCGSTWQILKHLTKQEIANRDVQLQDYTPGGMWDWEGRSINLPAAVIGKRQVFFRFRFKTFASGPGQYGTSNNFYLDRIHFSEFTTSVSDLENKNSGITIAPNPTTGSSFVMVKDLSGSSAMVQVTDIAGKVVYRTDAKLGSGITKIEIPANAIAVKGMYLVSVVTGSSKYTEKLIVF